MKKRNKVKLDMPRWTVSLYGVLAVALVPWTIYLGWSLPVKHVTPNWDVIWPGLDSGLFLSFLISAILAYRKSRWVTISSTITASFLLIDAWFDVLSSRSSFEKKESIVMALFIEIPLSILSFAIAGHVLRHNID